jgi:hypothetical protein
VPRRQIAPAGTGHHFKNRLQTVVSQDHPLEPPKMRAHFIPARPKKGCCTGVIHLSGMALNTLRAASPSSFGSSGSGRRWRQRLRRPARSRLRPQGRHG